jgi:hypothetical protein
MGLAKPSTESDHDHPAKAGPRQLSPTRRMLDRDSPKRTLSRNQQMAELCPQESFVGKPTVR